MKTLLSATLIVANILLIGFVAHARAIPKDQLPKYIAAMEIAFKKFVDAPHACTRAEKGWSIYPLQIISSATAGEVSESANSQILTFKYEEEAFEAVLQITVTSDLRSIQSFQADENRIQTYKVNWGTLIEPQISEYTNWVVSRRTTCSPSPQ